MKKIKLLSYSLAIFSIASMVSCSNGVSEITSHSTTDANSNFSVKQNSEDSDLYAAYQNAKRNLKPGKIFNGTAKEMGPDPKNTIRSDSRGPAAFLDLTKNTHLKNETFGEDYKFPKRMLNESLKEDTQGEFSTKACCGSGALHWGANISNISSPVNNKWGVYAGMTVDQTMTVPTYDWRCCIKILKMPPKMLPSRYEYNVV